MAKRRDVIKMRDYMFSQQEDSALDKAMKVQKNEDDKALRKAKADQDAKEAAELLAERRRLKEQMRQIYEEEEARIAKEEQEANTVSTTNTVNTAKTSKSSAELQAEADRAAKQIADVEAKFAEAKARKLSEIARLQAEAQKLAEQEAAEAKRAEEAKKAEEARIAAEAKKAREDQLIASAQLAQNTRNMVDAMKRVNTPVCAPLTSAPMPRPANTGFNGPAKVYEYYDPEVNEYVRTSDVWAAIQAAPGRWKAVWVMYQDGIVTHTLSSSEIRHYLPA